MRVYGFDQYNWEDDGYYFMVDEKNVFVPSVEPQLLLRPGTYATFGTSQVGAMNVVGGFGLIPGGRAEQMGIEVAFQNLFKKLNPALGTPREIRAIRNDAVGNDGQEVRLRGVLAVPNFSSTGQVNFRDATFVCVQPYWAGLVPSTGGFPIRLLDQSVSMPLEGEFPASPTIRLQPLLQRTAPVANAGWKWRRRYTLANSGDESLVNHPYALNIGPTNTLVSGGKMLASGNDLRVWINGQEVARNLNTINSVTDCLVWIIIPYLQPNDSMMIEVVYGNPVAGTPPTLVPMGDLPAFDIAATGASRSSNSSWVYLVDPTVASAGKGLWALSSGTVQGNYSTTVPGAWAPTLTIQAPDDVTQPPWVTYTATGTKYGAFLAARRARSGSTVVTTTRGADGVLLRVPVPIISIECDFFWFNQQVTDANITGIGQLVILNRQAQGDPWSKSYSNLTMQPTEVAIANAVRTLTSPSKEVAVATWPQNDVGVDLGARSDRYAQVRFGSTLKVALDSSLVVQAVLQAETEVYEIANEIRYGGGPYGEGPYGEYQKIVLGNAALASGAGTMRGAVELNQVLQIDNDAREVSVWDSSLTSRIETFPLTAVQAREGVYQGGVITDRPDPDWMTVQPVSNPMENPDASVESAPWLITQLGNPLWVWLNPEAHGNKGQAADIALWTDASGHAFNAASVGLLHPQLSYTQPPYGNLRSVDFTVAGDNLQMNVNGYPRGYDTFFFFAHASNLAAVRTLLGSSVNLGLQIVITTLGKIQVRVQGGAVLATSVTSTLAINVPAIIMVRMAPTQIDIQVNGGTIETFANSTALTATIGKLQLGARAPATTEPFLGSIFEYIHVHSTTNQVMQAAEYNKVVGYLAWKFNVQAKLPVGHPYAAGVPLGAIPGWSVVPGTPDTMTVSDVENSSLAFVSDPYSFSMNISSSVAPANSFVEAEPLEYMSVGGRSKVWFALWAQTANSNVVPRLGVVFYDSTKTPIGSPSMQIDPGTMTAGTWFRRYFAATVPAGAIYWKPRIRWEANVANATGRVYWDDYQINAVELAVYDPAPRENALSLTYSVEPRFSYA